MQTKADGQPAQTGLLGTLRISRSSGPLLSMSSRAVDRHLTEPYPDSRKSPSTLQGFEAAPLREHQALPGI